MVDHITPSKLHGIVGRIPRRSSFLRKMFFKRRILPTGARKIAFDQDTANKGIALFCHPMSNGRPIRERSWVTREFTPAYVKAWSNINPERVLDRMIGEDFSGSLDPAVRHQAIITRTLQDCLQIVDTRLEQQCYEGLIGGTQVISGDGIPEAITVNYGRVAGLTKQLTSTARWGETGVSPIDDIVDWIRELAAINGVAPNRVVLGPTASEYVRNDPKYEKLINQDYKRQTSGSQGDAIVLDSPEMGLLIGVLKAAGGSVELWEYQQQYEDESSTATKIMADLAVIIGYEHPEISQTECYGTIIDPAQNYQHAMLDGGTGLLTPMGVWHEFAKKPAIGEAVGVMCAPLMALTEKDANLAVLVR